MNVAIIPARGGSVRIKKKNIRTFHGKPIIAYSIEAALATGLFERVVVSTDDADIAQVAKQYGAEPWKRSSHLCEDRFGPSDVAGSVLFDLSYGPDLRYDYACSLYATAPMMLPSDIARGFEMLKAKNLDYVISVNAAAYLPLTDSAQFIWGQARAFFAWLPLFGEQTGIFGIDPARVCDVNVEADWIRAEQMYADLNRKAA